MSRVRLEKAWNSPSDVDRLLHTERDERVVCAATPALCVYATDESQQLVGYGEIVHNPIHPGVAKAYVKVPVTHTRRGIGSLILQELGRSVTTESMDVLTTADNLVGKGFLVHQGFFLAQSVREFSIEVSAVPALSDRDVELLPITTVTSDILSFVTESYSRKHLWLGETNLGLEDVNEMLIGEEVLSAFCILVDGETAGVGVVYYECEEHEVYVLEASNQPAVQRQAISYLLSAARSILWQVGATRFRIEVDSSDKHLLSVLAKMSTSPAATYHRYRRQAYD